VTMLMKVTLVHVMDGQTVENTFGLARADDTDPQGVAEEVGALLTGSAWMTGRSEAISLIRVRAEDDTPGVQATGEFVLPVPEAGTDGGNASPALCTLNIQWKGTGKGKAGRGRMCLSGYPASTAIGGFWTSDAQDPASAAASVIFDEYGPEGNNELCIINRVSGGAPLTPHTANFIKAFTIDNTIRRQGRRESGRGI